MISLDDARDAAEKYLARSNKPFTYQFINVELRLDEYSCLFAVYAAEGNEIDGPIIVSVDCHTGAVKPFVTVHRPEHRHRSPAVG